jgi:hypothetical protein
MLFVVVFHLYAFTSTVDRMLYMEAMVYWQFATVKHLAANFKQMQCSAHCTINNVLQKIISFIKSCYTVSDLYRETCLNQAMNKPDPCINRTLNNVTM